MTEFDDIRTRLLHDLAAEGVTSTVRIDQIDGERPDTFHVKLTYGQWSWREIRLEELRSPGERLRQVADDLQDDLAQDDLVHWPTCPGHPHPAVVRVDDDTAWWACPKTEHRLRRIGELATATEGT